MIVSLLQKLPLIAVGLLLFVAVMTIYFRAKNVTKSEFFKIFKNTRLISAWVMLFVILISGFFGIFNHLKSKQFAMAIISLNYSEASAAQNSNGTRYNMAEIICDEVVEKAIEKGALEDVTVKQLKKCLSVYPYLQGDVSDKTNYHISTEFAVEYSASKHTDHLDAANVVALITAAYKEYYVEKYTDNFALASKSDGLSYSDLEYMDIVSYFSKESSIVLNYLYGMADKAPSFVTKNNTTFYAIAQKVYQFKETQIEQNLKSLVLQYGIAKDKSNYLDRLFYQNQNTDFERQKQQISFELCNSAIAMYEKEMTRVVLVPTWDENGEYYMGRTKVGIDELSVMATSLSDEVSTTEKNMQENNLIIQKMMNSLNSSSATEQADALIATIGKGIDDYTAEAIAAGREYSNHTMNQCIAVTITGISLFSELKTIIVFMALAYVSATLYTVSKKFPKA